MLSRHSVTVAACLYLSAGAGASSLKEDPQWTIDPSTQTQQIIGVGAWSSGNDIGAASSNGVGGFMERWNGGTWKKEGLNGAAGLLMDAATSDVVSVGTSMLPVVISTDGGLTYSQSTSVSGVSQSASVFPPTIGDHIGLVGSFLKPTIVNGVAHSSDLGQTWTLSEIPGGYSRYGSFPSSDTWYVTAGIWAGYYKTATPNGHAFSSNLFFDNTDKTYRFSEKLSTTSQNVTSSTTDSGWFGKVWKTTDAGVTWSNVFSSNPDDTYYFNNIACSSTTHCVAVAEGITLGDYRAYVTSDGGATWTNALTDDVKPSNMMSLMSAGWFSDLEGWVAGVSKSGRSLIGLFFKTTDGGKTYTLDQQLDNCYPIDMDMTTSGHMGLAACLSSSGSSAAIATLK